MDYITEYLTKIRERRVIPEVQPGYMRALLPENAPLEAESWDSIFQDVEKIIMPGVRQSTILFHNYMNTCNGQMGCDIQVEEQKINM